MGDWTNATPTATGAGVLRPEEFARHVTLRRHAVCEPLSRFVENYWTLRWDLPPGRSYVSQTLPHPACSLTVERISPPRPGVGADPLVVTGVVTTRFDVTATGRGRVLGVKFRPGGLAALTGGRAVDWTDRTLPAGQVLPGPVCTAIRDATGSGDPDDWVGPVERALTPLVTTPDERYLRLLAVVTDLLEDPTLTTLAAVEQRHGVSRRTLQRWCERYVGVGPRWLVARYRMHDVVTALDQGYAGSLTDVAHRFGWYDQAHFTRDFVRLVGVTPGQYRAAVAAPDRLRQVTAEPPGQTRPGGPGRTSSRAVTSFPTGTP